MWLATHINAFEYLRSTWHMVVVVRYLDVLEYNIYYTHT